MKSKVEIIEIAKKTLQTEAEGIMRLSTRINDEFPKIVHQIVYLNARVIVTGIGKSAIIAQKIVSTFNSTGTPAIFMHAADAIHGDLGMIQDKDLVICISKSGNTPEIKVLTKNRLGAVAVVDNEQLTGIITDGDIRRMLEKNSTIEGLTAENIMSRSPKYIDKNELAVNALELLRVNNITQILVGSKTKFEGFVHLHDLLKEGII